MLSSTELLLSFLERLEEKHRTLSQGGIFHNFRNASLILFLFPTHLRSANFWLW